MEFTTEEKLMVFDFIGCNYHTPHLMKYLDSGWDKFYERKWNAAMQVVEKIDNCFAEELEAGMNGNGGGIITIRNNRCVISLGNYIKQIDNLRDTKLEAVWASILEYLKLKNDTIH